MKKRFALLCLVICSYARSGDGAVVFTNLHSFDVAVNGANPSAELVLGPGGDFYGTTPNGGTNGGFGTVFKVSKTGTLTTIYHFGGTPDGDTPAGRLSVAADGSMYGVTTYGGQYGSGTFYRIAPTGNETVLYSFGLPPNGTVPAIDGTQPQAGLLLGTNGDFYGVTSTDGQYGDGTVFTMTTDGAITTLYSFGGQTDVMGNPLDGSGPASELEFGPDGNLYGVTPYGGTYTDGTVFQITPQGMMTTLYSFGMNTNIDGVALDGSTPSGRLLRGTDGNLYGVTGYGGANDDGTMFEITPGGTLTTLYSFGSQIDPSGNILDGSYPSGGFVQAADGNYYGVTSYGGIGNGIVYGITADGATLTSLYSFLGTRDGANPLAAPVYLDGELYGVAPSAFSGNGNGSFYRVTPAGAFTVLFVFPETTDGGNPSANLTLGKDGNFYGTTEDAGIYNQGTLFRVTPTGQFSVVAQFDGNNGSGPEGDLLLNSDGSFYGTAGGGGLYGAGTVFKVTKTGDFTMLYQFGQSVDQNGVALDGSTPWAGVVFGLDGNLYGTTSAGGSFDSGTIYSVTPSGAMTSLVSFNGNNGADPMAGLLLGSDGNLYGTTASGGSYDWGTIFQVTPDGNLTTLYNFQNAGDGSGPEGALVEGTPGVFFGTTSFGGSGQNGTVFRLDPDGTLSTLFAFGGDNGSDSVTGLTQGPDGNFYGTTSSGGAAFDGVVFRISPQGDFSLLHDFRGAGDGSAPDCGLRLGPDGNLYGVAEYGGAGGSGTLYRLAFLPETAPSLQRIATDVGEFNFAWNATAGVTYHVQYKTRLSDPAWTDLGSPIVATNSTVSISDLIGANPQRFYRVVSP